MTLLDRERAELERLKQFIAVADGMGAYTGPAAAHLHNLKNTVTVVEAYYDAVTTDRWEDAT